MGELTLGALREHLPYVEMGLKDLTISEMNELNMADKLSILEIGNTCRAITAYLEATGGFESD